MEFLLNRLYYFVLEFFAFFVTIIKAVAETAIRAAIIAIFELSPVLTVLFLPWFDSLLLFELVVFDGSTGVVLLSSEDSDLLSC